MKKRIDELLHQGFDVLKQEDGELAKLIENAIVYEINERAG